MKRLIKHLSLITPILLLSIVLLGGKAVFAGSFLSSSDDVEVVSEESHEIAEGVTEGVITLKTSSGTSTAHVVLVQPNAKAKFKALIPGYYTEGSTAETRKAVAENWTDSSWSWLGVSDMVAQYQSAADTGTVLAAINGDFSGYEQGKSPRGSVVLEGNALEHSLAANDEYFFAMKKNGSLGIFKRNSGQSKYIQEGICAPFWILRNGEINMSGISDTDGPEKRTGAAIKPDGTSMMITVEAPGVTVNQLAGLMKASGFTNGQNLDGGRSITFLTKRADESNITRKSTLYFSDSGTLIERPISSALILVADDGPANAPIPAVTGTTLETDKDTYTAGEPINVTASSDVDGAWVSLLKAGDADNATSYFWYYANGMEGDLSWVNGETYDICGEGVCSNREGVTASSKLAAGDYKVVVLKGNYEKIAEIPITIEAAPAPQVDYTLELDKTVYQVGEIIKFKATAPVAETWVGLYHRNDVIPDDMSYFWYDLLPGDQGQWNALNINGGRVTEQDRHTSVIQHTIGEPLPEDDYKAVLFEAYSGDGTYKVKASVDFTISEEAGRFYVTYMDGDTVLTGIDPSSYKESDVANNGIALGKPEKTGHTFVNWYENPDFSGRPIRSLAQGSTGDKTFYAKFEKNSYTLTFDADGGSEVAPVTGVYQEAIDKPADPTKDGSIFCGWVTEKGGEGLFDFEKGLSDNTTVYASWRDEGSLAVSFDSNGGSGVATQGVAAGEKAVRPADPEKEGFVFDGWFSDKDLTKRFDFETTEITEDITLYARWIEKLEDMLVLSEESRGDKTYAGDASGVAGDYVGEKLYEYFYGDTVTVEATAEEPGAWVGVFQNKDFIDKKFDNYIGENWYYVDDYVNKDDRRVDLRTVNDSNLPFGIDYWAVLFSKDNKVLKAVPFNYRTFNVDRADAVEKNIKAELEWTSSVANGEDQKPALTIKQINENFNGVFEETLVAGKDYTVEYPSSSVEPGSYTIKVRYTDPSADNSDGSIHYMGKTEFEYNYYLTSSDGDYVISYVLGGGTNNDDNPQVYHTGTEVVLKSPSKVGFSFDGWFSDGKQISAILADAERNYTLTAKWVSDEDAPYAIKYVLNGGSNVVENPDSYTGNADINIMPIKKGKYSFEGWFFDSEFTQSADMIKKGTEGDLTLYAKFTSGGSSASTYNITTDVTGGTISSNKTVKKGGSYTVEYAPNEGYELSEILVDGTPVDTATYPASYTFENISEAHSISVTFVKAGSAPETKVGDTAIFSGSTYKVTSVTNSTVALIKAKNQKVVSIPANITIHGRKFKVIRIDAKAFTGSSIRTVYIGSNVKTIKASAFKSSKATYVVVKTKLLKKAAVKGSLKGSKVKTVKVKVSTKKSVNKTYVKKYKKYFTKANAGRKVTVK